MSKIDLFTKLFHCLKILIILNWPLSIFSGESWYKSLKPHNIKKSLRDEGECKSCSCYRTWYTLSPPITDLRELLICCYFTKK